MESDGDSEMEGDEESNNERVSATIMKKESQAPTTFDALPTA